MKRFDGDVTIQRGVISLIDSCHAPMTQLLNDPVWADVFPNNEWHNQAPGFSFDYSRTTDLMQSTNYKEASFRPGMVL
jgi:hypothetical protein